MQQGTYDVIPGSYKTLANAVHATDPRTGMMHTQIYVEPEKVAAEMQQLVQWTVENERKVFNNFTFFSALCTEFVTCVINCLLTDAVPFVHHPIPL